MASTSFQVDRHVQAPA